MKKYFLSKNWVLFLFIVSVSCSSSGNLSEFSSDGCTLFPDQSLILQEDWCDCCFEHDLAYWKGGSKEEREIADSLFKECILEKTGDKNLSELMYTGVRLGGSPYFPTWYRWGYGWDYPRGYSNLSTEEALEADKLLSKFFRFHADSSCYAD